MVFNVKGSIQQELSAVWWFSEQADRQGLSVPGFDHTWFGYDQIEEKIHEIEDRIMSGNEFFPPANWRPMFAMAQHYGIPTRMLDWSEYSYIAAYFASVVAAKDIYQLKSPKATEPIAVWALNENAINTISWPDDERIIIVRAPWASNDNLRAQKGLFTLHGLKLNKSSTSPMPKISQDNALEQILEKIKYVPEKPIIRCLQLDVNKAPDLLKLLSQIGVTASSLFPGYDGVVQSARDEGYKHG